MRALRLEWQDPEFRTLVAMVVGLLVLGVLVYTNVEGWSVIDALYFCVVTLATVGYGDLTPTTDFGKLFTIVYILSGIGIIVVFVSRIASGMVAARMDTGKPFRGRLRHRAEEVGDEIRESVEKEVQG
jgi:hypothetical protein